MAELDRTVWTGRIDTADGPEAVRWHQQVQPWTPGCSPGIVLVGFACDEGVRRNGGRVGARDGPRAIRAALANLAWHQELPVRDAGDVTCSGEALEAAQARLGAVVADLLRERQRPLILGGGHETSWGTFRGLASVHSQAVLGILNFDAHLDLRGDLRPSSGTAFAQIADWCRTRQRPFHYACLGIAEAANTAGLIERARQLNVRYVLDEAMTLLHLPTLTATVEAFLAGVDHLHLSVDLDVLPAAVLPAVSAPAARGVSLEVIEPLLVRILQTGKVRAVDLVEFNPALDADGRGARVAARLAWLIARHLRPHPEGGA